MERRDQMREEGRKEEERGGEGGRLGWGVENGSRSE